MAIEKIVLKKGTATAETYTSAAIDGFLNGKQAAGNYATLGSDGKVPASQLPSYVDDVLGYATRSSFPATGEDDKIYIAKDTNKTYRWNGTGYTEISASLALGETSSTAYAGDKGKANAQAISALQSGKADKATTLSGYGITDAYTKTEVDTKVNAKATKATTLSGYGITNAYTKSEIDNALADYVLNDAPISAGRAKYELTSEGINIFVEPNGQDQFSMLKITPQNIYWGNSRLATLWDVNLKADKATTLAGYGITDTYTKSQVDAAVATAVPKSKVMTTYTANYAISDGQIEIYLKSNNGTAAKEFKITPTSLLWNNQTIATLNDIPDISSKLDQSTTYTDYRAEFVSDDGGVGMMLTKLSNSTEYYALLTARGLNISGKYAATQDQIPDISGKADHATTAISSDGKTITFTFD